MRHHDYSRPRFFESWIFEALTEELAEDRADATGIELVLDRLFRAGAKPLVKPRTLPAVVRPARCDIAELSRLLEGDDPR
jgi:hypothetical protein